MTLKALFMLFANSSKLPRQKGDRPNVLLATVKKTALEYHRTNKKANTSLQILRRGANLMDLENLFTKQEIKMPSSVTQSANALMRLTTWSRWHKKCFLLRIISSSLAGEKRYFR